MNIVVQELSPFSLLLLMLLYALLKVCVPRRLLQECPGGGIPADGLAQKDVTSVARR